MGNFQRRRVQNDPFTEEQYINIKGTFSPAPFLLTIPAEFRLYTVNTVQ
jgi:hypothetical protein